MFLLASSHGIAAARRARWCVSNLDSSKYTQHFLWLTKPVPCPGLSLKVRAGDSRFCKTQNCYQHARLAHIHERWIYVGQGAGMNSAVPTGI
jgi:hypothetical protein